MQAFRSLAASRGVPTRPAGVRLDRFASLKASQAPKGGFPRSLYARRRPKNRLRRPVARCPDSRTRPEAASLVRMRALGRLRFGLRPWLRGFRTAKSPPSQHDGCPGTLHNGPAASARTSLRPPDCLLSDVPLRHPWLHST